MRMANQAFSISSLARCLSRADFYDEPRLSDDDFRKSVLEYALQLSQCDSAHEICIKKINIGDKIGYTAGNLASKLVLRRLKKTFTHLLISPQVIGSPSLERFLSI